MGEVVKDMQQGLLAQVMPIYEGVFWVGRNGTHIMNARQHDKVGMGPLTQTAFTAIELERMGWVDVATDEYSQKFDFKARQEIADMFLKYRESYLLPNKLCLPSGVRVFCRAEDDGSDGAVANLWLSKAPVRETRRGKGGAWIDVFFNILRRMNGEPA